MRSALLGMLLLARLTVNAKINVPFTLGRRPA
jgi:hypothetical protein